MLVGGLLAPLAVSAQAPATSEALMGPVAPLEVRFAEYGLTQEAPGEELYRQGRGALNQREYRQASERFRLLRERYPNSPFGPDAYYYEAFAEYRLGQEAEGNAARAAYRRALELLEVQAADFADAGTMSDARALRGRVQAELARMGDERSRAALDRSAQVACDDEDQELRAAALSSLLNMDEDRARPILKEVLASRDACSSELRAQAVFILSQHADDETVELLLDLAYRNPDPDSEVREQAVFWLGQVDHPEAVSALLDLLEQTDDPSVVESAIFALSQQDDPRAAEVLMDFARRPGADTEMRGQAIFWLSQQGGSQGFEFLQGVWTDVREPELKEAIIFAMSQTGEPEAIDFLIDVALDRREPVEVRKNALFWASQSGVPAETLLDIYGSTDDAEIQEAVIFGLSQHRGSQAVDALMDIARTARNTEMREQAIFWLGQMDDPRIAEFLLEIIRR